MTTRHNSRMRPAYPVFVLLCAFLLDFSAHTSRASAESLNSAVIPVESADVLQTIREERSLQRKYKEFPIKTKIDLDRKVDIPSPPDDDLSKWPPQIGVGRLLPSEYRGDLSTRLSDDWVENKNGSITAALTVTSPGASAIRAAILVLLPPGGEIRFFSPESMKLVQREQLYALHSVFKQQDLVTAGNDSRVVWSPIIRGDTIGIEVTLLNNEDRLRFQLRIDKISHIYSPLSRIQYTPSLIGCSGHIDVDCGSDYFPRGMQNAVARISYHRGNGEYLCTGTLMNSNRGKGTIKSLYFLTANHCISDQTTADSMVAVWYYQRSGCEPTDGLAAYSQTYRGAELLTTSVAQDSTLLRLRGGLPLGPYTFAGWTTDIPQIYQVYGIHHPGGGLKKFSLGQTTGSRDERVCRRKGDCFVVKDAISVGWEHGLTEGGSSGSGLFLFEHLFGVLSGGPAGCSPAVSVYGPFRDFYKQAKKWLGPGERCGWGKTCD